VAEDFKELEGTINVLLQGISPARRGKKLREIGRELRRRQADRIADQKNPDGSSFKPRSKKLRKRKIKESAKFLYPTGGVGAPRVVLLKSYTTSKRHLIGFDVERRGMRTFKKAKILKYLPKTATEENKNAGKWRKPTKAENKMFKKIKAPRFLRSYTSSDELRIGFTGRVATIARAHQYGQSGRPQRRLIGLSSAEQELIMDKVLELFKT
jgi:hypothetical protein